MQTATYSLDIVHTYRPTYARLAQILDWARKHELALIRINPNGPAGGNPEFSFTGPAGLDWDTISQEIYDLPEIPLPTDPYSESE